LVPSIKTLEDPKGMRRAARLFLRFRGPPGAESRAVKIGPRGVLAAWARRIAAASGVLFATACSRPPPPPPPSDAALEDTEIRFDVGGCYGTCAVYAVTLRGDGAVDYEGKAFVAVKGHRAARVAPSAIAELVRHFDAVNFDGMTWRKNCPEKYTTDHGTVRVTFRRGDRSHTLDHDLGDGCAPADLHRLEDHLNMVMKPAIDDLVRCDAATCLGPE
jgi:hypothetical protein